MKIRHWKLGNLEHKIVPTLESIELWEKKIKELFPEDMGVVDIVSGPDLEIIIKE